MEDNHPRIRHEYANGFLLVSIRVFVGARSLSAIFVDGIFSWAAITHGPTVIVIVPWISGTDGMARKSILTSPGDTAFKTR